MTREEEDLAVALWAIEKHGARAEAFVAGQIGALALSCDEAGIARWRAIAAELQALRTRNHQ